MEKMKEIKKVLKEYEGIQVFNTQNSTNDDLMLVYQKNNVTIHYCPDYEYLEILGLDDYEYNNLIKLGDFWDEIRKFDEEEIF